MDIINNINPFSIDNTVFDCNLTDKLPLEYNFL